MPNPAAPSAATPIHATADRLVFMGAVVCHRIPRMEYRQLGHSGISVSALSLGSWMTYETMDERDARAVIQAGLEQGINFLDDARYNDRTGKAPLKTGYSEVLFGRLLRQTGVDRASLVIANKLWF